MRARNRARGHSDPAKWTPSLESGVACWLRADKGITIGTGVSAWANQRVTTPTRHFTQGTGASQPVFTSPSATFNGKPMVGNTGSKFLTPAVGDFDFMHNGTSFSLYTVFRVTDNAASWMMSSFAGSSANKGIGIFRSGGSIIARVGNGAAQVVSQTTTTTTTTTDAYLLRWIFTPGSSVKSTLRLYRPSSSVDGTATTSTLTAACIAGNSTNPLGIYANGAGAFGAVWDMAELIILNSEVTPADDAKLIRYLRQRYAL